MDSTQALYRTLAGHYRAAIRAGSLAPGERMPSVRSLMRLHGVSLSTALETCRFLEEQGWVEARPRSGYFVRPPKRAVLPPPAEPVVTAPPDPAQFVGIHAVVSEIVAKGRQRLPRVNLSGARAAPHLYPAAALRNAGLRALRNDPDLLVRAGTPGGNAAFRAVLAKRALSKGVVVAPEDIIVTHGCIEALNLALRAVAQPGDIIAVESPTFYGLLQVLESLGLRALEIPAGAAAGLSLEALELALRSYDNIKAVVVVPHLQNPLGAIMPDAHKQGLVKLCEERGIALIEDDTYSDLIDDETPPNAIKAWDRSGNVIHCASLHKTLAPGMRLGWITAGRWQARVAMLKYAQTRDNEEWSQLAAAEFIASPDYDRHLRRLRTALKAQRERMAEAAAHDFPGGTRLTMPAGGVTLWLELPHGLSSQSLFGAALEEGILVAPGIMFSNSNRFDGFVRLSCGAAWSDDLQWAMKTLGDLATRMCRQATADLSRRHARR